MIPADEQIHHWLGQLLKTIGKLAPLSIVVAALSFLYTLRQGRAKRDEDKARNLREILNKAGIMGYLLNWSSIGNFEFSAAVLRVRELIEERVGKAPSASALVTLFGDQLLMDSIVEKAWRDSGVGEKFRQHAFEFGQLQAAMGNRIPLVQEAFEAISAGLRVSFMTDVFIVNSIRTSDKYRRIPPRVSGDQEAIAYIHRQLLSAAQVPKMEAFSKACTVLQRFAEITAVATDKSLLKITASPTLVFRVEEYFHANKQDRLDRPFRQQATQTLAEKFPAEASLLTQAVDGFLRQRRNMRANERRLQTSYEQIAHVFRGLKGSTELNESCREFIAERAASASTDLAPLEKLISLKCMGVNDPQIDFSLGLGSDVLDLLKSALSRGADQKVGLQETLDRYGNKLTSRPAS
jgi:hypothetical protein